MLRSPFRRRSVRRIPRNRVFDRLLNVGRTEQLRPYVLAKMLGLGVLGARNISKEQALVHLLVNEMLVDRLRTLGATNRINDELVSDIVQADQVSHDVLDDAKLFFGSDTTRETDDTASHRNVDIIGIERELVVESVAHERAKLAVNE